MAMQRTSVILTGGVHSAPPISVILVIRMLLLGLKPRSHPMMYVPTWMQYQRSCIKSPATFPLDSRLSRV